MFAGAIAARGQVCSLMGSARLALILQLAFFVQA